MIDQKTYIRNLFELKDAFIKMGQLSSNHSIFTYDATKMYNRIKTSDCIQKLATFLRLPSTRKKFSHYAPEPLIAAIEIVMRNNRFKFGDVLVKQIQGIAMGISPAPPITNLYVAIYKEEEILDSVVQKIVSFLKYFPNDGIGLWLHHLDSIKDKKQWRNSKKTKNSGCLDWVFMP